MRAPRFTAVAVAAFSCVMLLATSAAARPVLAASLTLPSELQIAADHPSLALLNYSSIDSSGALGMNQGEWHSIGQQRHISPHVLRGLAQQDLSELSSAVLAMEYSFAHQKPDGSFIAVPLANMAHSFQQFDPVGTSFFYSDLGRSLSLLSESSWFMTSSTTQSLLQRVQALTPKIALGLSWLTSAQPYAALQSTGRAGTNRWTFGADALILTGQWLGNGGAQTMGMNILDAVLAAQQPDGTFPELGGFDSSYQGVTLSNLVFLLVHLNQANSGIESTLESAIERGLVREQRAVLSTGQIVTQGNTRVYCGGESFLGEQKGGNYKNVIVAFTYQGEIINTASYFGVASSVNSYYQTHPSPASCVVPAMVLNAYGGLYNAGTSFSTSGAPSWRGWPVARSVALSPSGNGGYVLDVFGGLHPFGGARPLTGGPYWRNWAIARGFVLRPQGGGYVLDGWGGVHPCGGAPAVRTTSYWRNWDIARGIALNPDGNGGYVLDGFGGAHPFGDAPAVRTTSYWRGWDIARGIVTLPGGGGGYVLDGFGGLHPFGSAPSVQITAYWRWDIARSVALSPDGTSGMVLDGYGGLHPFVDSGGVMPPAPGGTPYWPGHDIARALAAG